MSDEGKKVRWWRAIWGRILVAAALGAFAFVGTQVIRDQPMHIAEYLGRQIARQGGYPESAAGVIGWSVHGMVALTYAALYGWLVSLPLVSGSRPGPFLTGILLVPPLGYLTTAIAAPAIAVTIGLLSGQGWPASLPPLNWRIDFIFWNHMLFFLICWAVLFLPAGRGKGADEATADARQP